MASKKKPPLPRPLLPPWKPPLLLPPLTLLLPLTPLLLLLMPLLLPPTLLLLLLTPLLLPPLSNSAHSKKAGLRVGFFYFRPRRSILPAFSFPMPLKCSHNFATLAGKFNTHVHPPHRRNTITH